MISLETLRAVQTIYVHGGGCPDGIASAILLHDALPNARVKFIQYNSEEHRTLPIEPHVLFADFTPKEDQVTAFVQAGAIVLDHHKGAKDIVAAFGDNGRFGDEVAEPGVCGAVLCYRHVWEPIFNGTEATHRSSAWVTEMTAAKDFAILAGIRDTWQRQDPRWTEACEQAEMLRFYPPEEYWLNLKKPFDAVNREMWNERRALGKILVEKHAQSVKRTLEKSWRFTSAKGTRVVAFEGTGTSSDASDVLQDADLVIGFGFHCESSVQKMVFSCRTRVGYDVLGFAKAFGGGGHSSAAGFNQDITKQTLNPYQLTELLVNEHEAKK